MSLLDDIAERSHVSIHVVIREGRNRGLLFCRDCTHDRCKEEIADLANGYLEPGEEQYLLESWMDREPRAGPIRELVSIPTSPRGP